MSTILRQDRAASLLMLLAIGVVLGTVYVGLGHPIQDNNEGLYARVALEMLDRHSWVIPTADGVPYLEKPPLLYWITAAAFAVLGPTEAAARFAPMVGFVLFIAALYAFAHRWWGARAAILATCVGASSPIAIVMARMLMFDMLFTGLFAWAVFAMYEGVARAGGRRWVRLAYAALALAVLTKGFVAIVFYGALACAAVLERREGRAERLRRVLDPAGIAMFVAISVPWHVAAALSEPTFGWFYFINEHVLRFLGLRVPHDYYGGSYLYYVPRIVVAMAPWILVFALPRPRDDAHVELRRFLWLAFLLPFLFFSMAGAKANYYIVITVPPLALLVARRLERMQESRWVLVVPLGWIAFLASAAFAVPLFAPDMRLPGTTGVLGACALALSMAGAIAFYRRRTVEGTLAVAAVAIPFAALFSGYLDANRDQNSMRGMAAEVDSRGFQQVFVYRDYEAMSSLGYYLHRPIGIIDSASNDLWYGMRLRPDRERFPAMAQFIGDDRYRHAAIVVANRRTRELLRSPLARHLQLVARIGRSSLFVWRQ